MVSMVGGAPLPTRPSLQLPHLRGPGSSPHAPSTSRPPWPSWGRADCAPAKSPITRPPPTTCCPQPPELFSLPLSPPKNTCVSLIASPSTLLSLQRPFRYLHLAPPSQPVSAAVPSVLQCLKAPAPGFPFQKSNLSPSASRLQHTDAPGSTPSFTAIHWDQRHSLAPALHLSVHSRATVAIAPYAPAVSSITPRIASYRIVY